MYKFICLKCGYITKAKSHHKNKTEIRDHLYNKHNCIFHKQTLYRNGNYIELPFYDEKEEIAQQLKSIIEKNNKIQNQIIYLLNAKEKNQDIKQEIIKRLI